MFLSFLLAALPPPDSRRLRLLVRGGELRPGVLPVRWWAPCEEIFGRDPDCRVGF